MIRAKRLEWKQIGLSAIQGASLGGFDYLVVPTSGGIYPPGTFAVDAAFCQSLPPDSIGIDVDDKDFYYTLEEAKAACQAHADALAREIAEIDQ